MGRSSKEIDWECIERDYRVGVLTIQMLLEKHGINRATLHRRAKKYKWTRDLSEQVQAATKAKVNALIIHDATNTQQTRNINDAFEVNSQADINAAIIRSHQKVAATQKGMMEKLMSNMQEQIEAQKTTIDKLIEAVSLQHPDAIKDLYKVLSLPTQVETMKKFTEIHNNIVATERKAFRIDVEEKQADNTSIDDVIKRAREHPDYDIE